MLVMLVPQKHWGVERFTPLFTPWVYPQESEERGVSKITGDRLFEMKSISWFHLGNLSPL